MLRLVKPEFGELTYRQSLLADAETMSYNKANGGVIDFPVEEWNSWYGKWLENPGMNRYYAYIYCDVEREYIGEISYEIDPERHIYLCNIIIDKKFRGKGYGKQALEALIRVAKFNGICELCEELEENNPFINMFKEAGFKDASLNNKFVLLRRAI